MVTRITKITTRYISFVCNFKANYLGMYRTNQKMTKTYKAGININVKLESPIISLIITSTKNIMKINKYTVYRVFFPSLYTCKQFHPRLELLY